MDVYTWSAISSSMGFVAFLLHYIPNIGAAIAAIPAMLMALVQLEWGVSCLWLSLSCHWIHNRQCD